MSFDWGDFYGLASDLFSPACTVGKEDARLRTSISRAYYGALNAAKLRLLGNGYKPQGRDSHEQTILDIEQQAGAKQAAAHLRRMKDARHRADYDDSNFSRSRDLAKKTLFEADQVLKSLP